MLLESRFFNSENKDRVYFAEDFAEYFNSFIGTGIIPMNRQENSYLDGFKVETKEGMTLKVSKGNAIIEGYYAKTLNGEDVGVKIDVADSRDRIDRIVLRLDYEKRMIDLVVLKGAMSETAKPQDIIRNDDYYDLAIADVLVKGNSSHILQSNIKDTRADKDLCGWCQLNINTPAIGGSYGVPGGTVIAWHPRKDADGEIKIPTGWILCDGENGTPDLMNRFIMGGTVENAGGYGGTNNLNLKEENIPAHKHKAKTSLDGRHEHSGIYVVQDPEASGSGGSGNYYGYTKINIPYSGEHTHDVIINDEKKSVSPVDNRPAFYSLVYIMKI